MPLLEEKVYTIDDIYALPEGERAELIDGHIYYMAPPNRTHQTGLLRLSLQAAVEWITIPNFLNIVLPVFGNTGLLILKRTGLLFIILNLKIPQNILFLILLRLGFMKIS